MSYKLALEKLKALKSKELVCNVYYEKRAKIHKKTSAFIGTRDCYCALGALNTKTAKLLPQLNIDYVENFAEGKEQIKRYQKFLAKKYNLSLSEAAALQQINDETYDDTSERYETVINWLEERVKEEEDKTA